MNQNKNGKFIAKMRKEKNMTQQDLAEKMGVSVNAVSKWERGLSFPDVSLYKDICKELDINIEELINGEKDTSDEAKEKAIIKTVRSKEIINKKFKRITIISIIIILLLIAICIFLYKKNDDSVYDYYYSYATNDWYNTSLVINKKIPAGISVYSTKEEAINAFPKNELSVKPFLIMHRMYKDTILESYIMFNKDGKYYRIRGGYKASNINDNEILEIQEQNRKTLIEALGKDSCSVLDDSYYCKSDYELANGNWTIKVQDDGRVRAAGYDSFCVIDKNGTSGCGVTPKD